MIYLLFCWGVREKEYGSNVNVLGSQERERDIISLSKILDSRCMCITFLIYPIFFQFIVDIIFLYIQRSLKKKKTFLPFIVDM
jgi:hypothetical protein